LAYFTRSIRPTGWVTERSPKLASRLLEVGSERVEFRLQLSDAGELNAKLTLRDLELLGHARDQFERRGVDLSRFAALSAPAARTALPTLTPRDSCAPWTVSAWIFSCS